MADKPRTPNPPRKVQAPKVRQKASSSQSSLPWTNILIGLGTVAIVGLVVALLVVLSGGRGSTKNVTAAEVAEVKTAMTRAGCSFRSTPADPSQKHMSDPDQVVSYKTFPAVSGVHDPTTSVWGNYRVPVDPRQAIHNLEHGGIAIWYGPQISASDRGALDTFYEGDPNGLIISPIEDPDPRVKYPKHQKLGSKIALTVWTLNTETGDATNYIAVCPSFVANAFAAYRDAFRGVGPERFPVSKMTPGEN